MKTIAKMLTLLNMDMYYSSLKASIHWTYFNCQHVMKGFKNKGRHWFGNSSLTTLDEFLDGKDIRNYRFTGVALCWLTGILQSLCFLCSYIFCCLCC